MKGISDAFKLVLLIGLVLAIMGATVWILTNWDSIVSNDDSDTTTTTTTISQSPSEQCEFVPGRGMVRPGTREPCNVLPNNNTTAATTTTTAS